MGEARWSAAGGSVPHGKCPSRPLFRSGGRNKPAPVLKPVPTVAPSAMSASVSALTRPGGRAHGGAGQVPGATAAPLDRLADPST